MKHFLLLFSTIILVSCGGANKIVTEAPIYPNWISSRPISNEFYIGIAKSSKANADYQSIAKQNALLDLSSEISVKLSSESIFHQVDKGDSYREDYQSLIHIESQKNLEAYTLLASWENEKEYWLYYQLSKSEWNQLRIERKQKALNQAYNYYKLAEKFSGLTCTGGDIILSGLLHVQAEECLSVYSSYFNISAPVFNSDWARLHGTKI